MKTRMIKMGLVLTAIMFAVGLVGCPNDGGDNPPPAPVRQKGAFLSRVTIGAAQAGFTPGLKSTLKQVVEASYQGDEDLQAASSAKSLDLVVVKSNGSDKATVQIAIIATLAATPSWTSSLKAPSGGWADGTFVLLKVTAQDGTTVNYYRVNISLGQNATLQNVTIGFTPRLEETWLGKPAAALASVTEGTFRTDPISNKSIFKITPVDSDAEVNYAFVSGAKPSTNPSPLKAFAEYENGVLWSTIDTPTTQVKEGDYLFISVKPSATTGTTLIYLMKIEFPRVGTVKYGTPQLFDPANPGSAWYEDPVWGTDWTYDISRFNAAETYPAWFKTEWGQHTVAKAKVLWDEDGIWALVDVTFNQYKTEESGEEKDRVITNPAEHDGDSVELFINERLQILDDTNKDIGDQYRVGPLNQRSGKGAPAVSPDPATDIGSFTGFGNTKTRTVLKKADGSYGANLADATNGGYKVILQAPFKHKTQANADDVFENSVVKAGAQIGLELQLNTGAATNATYGGGRDGILTWNGVNTQAFGNAGGYGVVTLEAKPAGAPAVDAFPTITARTLADKSYLPTTVAGDVDELSVTASESPSYQWYVGTGPSGAGVAATGPGANTSTYKPVITAGLKDEYYYAIMTNGGTRVASPRAKISTVDTLSIIDKWVIPGDKIKITAPWNGTIVGSGNGLHYDGASRLMTYKLPAGTFTKMDVVFKVVYTDDDDTPVNFWNKDASGSNPDWPGLVTGLPLTLNAQGISEPVSYAEMGTSGYISWQNGGAFKADITIESITLYTADISGGTLYLNPFDLATTQYNINDDADPVFNDWLPALAVATPDNAGKITFAYDTTGQTGNRVRQRAIINLTTEQAKVINDGTTYDLEIKGSADGTGFRVGFISGANSGSSWNSSGLPGNPLTFTDGIWTSTGVAKANAGVSGGFVLQSMSAGELNVVIEYIKVTVNP